MVDAIFILKARIISVYFNSPEEQTRKLHLPGYISGRGVFFFAAGAKKLYGLDWSVARLSGVRPGNPGRLLIFIPGFRVGFF